jgi:hypothetical protein
MLGDFLNGAVPDRLGANAFELVLHLVQAGQNEDASAATASARISGAAFLAWIFSTIEGRCARSSVLCVALPERPLRRTRRCAPNGRVEREAKRSVSRAPTIRRDVVWPIMERLLWRWGAEKADGRRRDECLNANCVSVAGRHEEQDRDEAAALQRERSSDRPGMANGPGIGPGNGLASRLVRLGSSPSGRIKIWATLRNVVAHVRQFVMHPGPIASEMVDDL